ncbi:MAG TPA: ABC transporter permease, partial [Candidatus Ozemobacteraceae bacterium]|nr:ABC transporter permease [Candidatus Ozemobacteraceae bacterium]
MNLSLIFERRPQASYSFTILVLFCSLATGCIAAALLFLLRGVSPWLALQKIFVGSFGSWYGFQETVAKAIPLALTGIGLTVAFRARFWNIGAEGQILAGAVGATAVALYGPQGGSGVVTITLLFLAGAFCGALWAFIPALLRLRWQVNEVISTLMLNYIAIELVQYLIYGPWKGKSQMGFPYSDDFPSAATLPTWGYTRIHLPTLILTLLAAAALWIFLQRLTYGYEIRVSGENPDAAAYAGIPSGRVLVLAMMISGALAGCAGVGEVAGIHRHLTYPWAISSGYGYT